MGLSYSPAAHHTGSSLSSAKIGVYDLWPKNSCHYLQRAFTNYCRTKAFKKDMGFVLLVIKTATTNQQRAIKVITPKHPMTYSASVLM